jgi:hypothetical protein
LEPANPKSREFAIKAVLFFFFLSSVLVLLVNNIADPDLWGYLSFGRLFWQSKTFPYHDVFAYTPTLNLWVYHEWLTGVLYYPLYKALGAPGLEALKYALALGTMGLVYLTARMRGAYPLAAALFVLIILGGARFGYSPVRAQVFTFFFFALSLYVLERARLKGISWSFYLLPLIQPLWCNLHGGFLTGLGLIAIYSLGEFIARRPWRPYIVVFFLSSLFTLVNPYGLEYWQYLARAVTMPRPDIAEWASVFDAFRAHAANFALIIYLLTLCLAGLFAMWRSHWRDVTATLALVATLVLALNHIRHLPFFLILAGAYLPVCLTANLDYLRSRAILQRLWGLASLKGAVLMVFCAFTLLNFFSFFTGHPFSLRLPQQKISQKLDAYYPVNAVSFIKKQGLHGKILAKFIWGEYLIWELYPQCKVAFDGRYETVYPTEIEEKYSDFHYARPQWRQFLEDYPPNLILLDKRDKIANLILEDPHWRQVYFDSNFVLFMASRN